MLRPKAKQESNSTIVHKDFFISSPPVFSPNTSGLEIEARNLIIYRLFDIGEFSFFEDIGLGLWAGNFPALCHWDQAKKSGFGFASVFGHPGHGWSGSVEPWHASGRIRT